MAENMAGNWAAGTELPSDGAHGAATATASHLVALDRPTAGQTLQVQTQVGQLIQLEFNPASAKVSIDGDDFLFTLEDGARVVFQGLVSVANGEDAPMFRVAGINIEADVLIDEALRIPGEDGFIDTAGHEDGDDEDVTSDGSSDYREATFSDLIASLISRGALSAADLGFHTSGHGGLNPMDEMDGVIEGSRSAVRELYGSRSIFDDGPATTNDRPPPTANIAMGTPTPGISAPTSAESFSEDPEDDQEAAAGSGAPVGAVGDGDGAADSVAENAADGTAVGITALASDADGTDTVTYSLSDDAGGRFAIDAGSGVITVANGGLLDYETATSHSVTVQATSSDGSTSSQAFTVNLSDVAESTAPGAEDDAAPTDVDTAVVIAVLANDSDPNSDPLSVASVTQGANGTVVINGDDTVTYTPDLSFTGTDTFTYTADDGNGGTDTATVTVYVGIAIEGTSGGETLRGGAGADDVIFGHGGNDTLRGKSGDDYLYGGAGDDLLKGEDGDDILFGEDGDDTLLGGKGNGGNDILYGGAGNDMLDGGDQIDTLDGGPGNDILVWDSIDAVIDGGSGDDTLQVDSGDVDLTTFAGTIVGIEKIDLESNTGANTVILTVSDVLDMSDTDSLTIAGDAGDSIDAGSGWTDGGIAGGYHVYTQGLATLSLDIDLSVNPGITS